jgi:threonine synthase
LKDPEAAAEAGGDPRPVPNDTDGILRELAGGGGLLSRIRALL